MAQLTFASFADAIAGVLAGKWPARIVYRDVCPVDFQRPSFFLQCIKTMFTPESRCLCRFSADYLLTLFDVKDAHYEVSAERLLGEQVEVLALFSSPVLDVGGRFPSLLAVAGEGREPDSAFVTLHVEWVGPSPAYLAEQAAEAADTELMEEFAARINANPN